MFRSVWDHRQLPGLRYVAFPALCEVAPEVICNGTLENVSNMYAHDSEVPAMPWLPHHVRPPHRQISMSQVVHLLELIKPPCRLQLPQLIPFKQNQVA